MERNRFLESRRKELFPSDRFGERESFRRGTKVSSSAAHRISEWERTLSNRSKNGVVDTNRLPSVIQHSPTSLDNGRSSRNAAWSKGTGPGSISAKYRSIDATNFPSPKFGKRAFFIKVALSRYRRVNFCAERF